jgi:N-acetylglutamate synthase-like GNAT family acetyltransferase
MSTKPHAKIIDVTAENVVEKGFFCCMSKPKTAGYRRKLSWRKARFAEGMRIKMYELPQRGFIEYIPGEYAWRTVDAKGDMFIHCLWIVGKSKGQGLGGRLLKECIKDAREAGMHGVAMPTSEGNWLAGKELLLQHGFKLVAQAPPAFNLTVMQFDGAPPPALLNSWEKKKVTAWVGIIGFTFLSVFTIWWTFVPVLYDVAFYLFGMVGGLFALAWFALVSLKFFKLGRTEK